MSYTVPACVLAETPCRCGCCCRCCSPTSTLTVALSATWQTTTLGTSTSHTCCWTTSRMVHPQGQPWPFQNQSFFSDSLTELADASKRQNSVRHGSRGQLLLACVGEKLPQVWQVLTFCCSLRQMLTACCAVVCCCCRVVNIGSVGEVMGIRYMMPHGIDWVGTRCVTTDNHAVLQLVVPACSASRCVSSDRTYKEFFDAVPGCLCPQCTGSACCALWHCLGCAC